LALYAKKSSGILTITDLIGKRVMFNTDSVGGGADICAMLAKRGVDPSTSFSIYCRNMHENINC